MARLTWTTKTVTTKTATTDMTKDDDKRACGCTETKAKHDDRDLALCVSCGHLVGWHDGDHGQCLLAVKGKLDCIS